MRFINYKTLYTLSGLILFSSIISLNADAKSRQKPIHITRKDRAQIIESILRKELSRENFVKIDKYLFISNEFFSLELVPAIYRDKIEFIEQEEVKKRAQTAKGIQTFSFRGFKVKGHKVIVEITNSQSYAMSFRVESNTYEYKRITNQWDGRATEGWITIADPRPEND